MKVFTYRGAVLPEHLQESILAYVEQGRPTGSFLDAILNNDLRQAVTRADDENLPLIPVIVAFLYNECPHDCWGFPGASDAWINNKRQEREKENHVSH